MTSYPHSLVVICPDDLKAEVLSLGLMLDPPVNGGLSVPLSAVGSEPASHWGAHAWASPEFVAIMRGDLTPDIPGVTPQEIADTLAQLTVSVDAEGLTMRAHFDHVIANLNLHTVTIESAG